MKIKNFYIILGVLITLTVNSYAGVDPTRAALFLEYKNKEKQWHAAQAAILAANAEAHTFTRRQLINTAQLKEKYSQYLGTVNDILNYLGTTYGIYSHVKETIRAIRDLKTALRKHPSGLLATSLSARKSTLLLEVGITTGSMIDNIRDVFLKKEERVDQRGRLIVLNSIRVDLERLNKKLWMLSRAITYTSLVDDWNELIGLTHSYKQKDRKTICKNAMHRWAAVANQSVIR